VACAAGSRRSAGLKAMHVDLQLMSIFDTVISCRIMSRAASCALQVSQTRCLRVSSSSSPFQPLRSCSRRRSLQVKVQPGSTRCSQHRRTTSQLISRIIAANIRWWWGLIRLCNA
jgi:hypothetical protein